MLDSKELTLLKDLSRHHHEMLIRCVSELTPGMNGLDCAVSISSMLEESNRDCSLIRLDVNRNNIVCHAPPDSRPFSEGDIITLDMVLEQDGLFADGAWSIICGEDILNRKKLLEMAWLCARQAVLSAIPGKSSLEMKKDLHSILRESEIFLLEEACGHGIGKELHMSPDIHYQLRDRNDIIWNSGMLITSEPVLTRGETCLIQNSSEQWVTENGRSSAYFEHMCFIGEDEPVCLNIPEIKDINRIDIF